MSMLRLDPLGWNDDGTSGGVRNNECNLVSIR